MKEVSADVVRKGRPPVSAVQTGLIAVTNTFVQLQENRHAADYDLGVVLMPDEVALDILLVEDAFRTWGDIKDDPIVQDYLFSLLFKDRS
jgi:hypothetical protein